MSADRKAAWRGAGVFGVAAALLALAVLAVVGVTATTLPGCAGCHFEEPSFEEATLATAHSAADTTCVDCHVETGSLAMRAKFGFYQVFGMWLPLADPSSTDAVVVRDSRCVACHETVMEGVTESSGLRIQHALCAEGRACTACHSEVGHGAATAWPRISSMNDCTRCHNARKASVECETCHTGKMTVARSTRPEFGVTHGPNWRQTHGMGEMSSCSSCHAEDSCGKCHGPGVPHGLNFQLKHAEISLDPAATCVSCHDQAFCDSCHLIEMPHPREFVTGHSDTVEREGNQSCLRCHVIADCDTCHVKHVHPGGAVGAIPSPGRSGD